MDCPAYLDNEEQTFNMVSKRDSKNPLNKGNMLAAKLFSETGLAYQSAERIYNYPGVCLAETKSRVEGGGN